VGTFATQTLAELGYETVWATNAEAALAQLSENADRFDAVFSDVVMPGMSGVKLAQRIHRDYQGPPSCSPPATAMSWRRTAPTASSCCTSPTP